MFYETAAGVTVERIMEIYPRHKAWLDQFAERGKIIGIGPFGNPGEGSMGIFRDRESAEDFVKDDPFVLEGIVAKYTIKEWNDDML